MHNNNSVTTQVGYTCRLIYEAKIKQKIETLKKYKSIQ